MLGLLVVGLLACRSAAPTGDSDRSAPPVVQARHVVLVLADDLGWADPSSPITSEGHGSDFHDTPRIDALAESGVAFTRAWAAPVCSPGRAQVETGRNAAATGIYTNAEGERGDESLRALGAASNVERLSSDATTLAERLRAAGFRTGHFGKWHLGRDGDGDGPLDQGYDVNVGGDDQAKITGGSDGHFAQESGAFLDLPGLGPNGVPYQFSTDRLADEAIAWLAREPSTPTFLTFAPFAVHNPVQAPAADQAPFLTAPPGARHADPVYAGMIANLDAAVGRLLDALEATDDPGAPGSTLADTTLVILTSDNGGEGSYAAQGIVLADRTNTDNWPLSGGKGTLYEGGLRVPLVLRGPGIVPAEVRAPVVLVDLVPTVLEAVGLPAADDLDGVSLWPALHGGLLARTQAYHHFPAYLEAEQGTWRAVPTSVARDEGYKLMYDWETRSVRLFDLDVDPGEQLDLAPSLPDEADRLLIGLVAWLQATNAALPRDLATGAEVELPTVNVR